MYQCQYRFQKQYLYFFLTIASPRYELIYQLYGKKKGFECSSIRYNMSSWFWCGKRAFLSDSFSVAERTKPRRSKLCHSSCDLLLWNFWSWFQVRVAPTPPQLYRHPSLVLLIKWRGSHKAAERAWVFISEVDQTSLCLSACLSAYLSAWMSLHFWGCISVFQLVCLRFCLSHLSVRLPVRSPCLSSCSTASVYLPLSPRLSLCNLTCLLSLVFFRAWLVGWPTFGLIRVTYRRAAGTHMHAHTRINMNAQAAHSASHWPSALARTANHPLISTTDLWVFKTHSLIWSTTCVHKDPALQPRLHFFFLIFRSLHQGGIWGYDNIQAYICSCVHTQRAIITLLHHTRESCGKPREAAESEV